MRTIKSTKDTKLATTHFACFVPFVVKLISAQTNTAIRLSFALLAATATAFAQCAMCKTNIAGAENAAEVSSTLNIAVLILLIPALAIIGGVVRLVFKYRHPSHTSYVNFRPSNTQRDPE